MNRTISDAALVAFLASTGKAFAVTLHHEARVTAAYCERLGDATIAMDGIGAPYHRVAARTFQEACASL